MNWHTMVTPPADTPRARWSDSYVRREGADISGADLQTATAQLFYVEGGTTAPTWPEVAADLVEYWQQAARLFTAALPGQPPRDRLHIHINPEGGQLKSYLGDTTDKFRPSPIVVNGIVTMMADEYEALPDPEEFEQEFGAGYDQLCLHARDALITSSAAPAAAPMKDLVTRHNLTVLLRWKDNGETEELKFA